jgi:hypothetical protein
MTAGRELPAGSVLAPDPVDRRDDEPQDGEQSGQRHREQWSPGAETAKVVRSNVEHQR